MNRATLFLLLAAASVATAARAQGRPDFSGVWTTATERGPIAAVGGARPPSGGAGSAAFRSGDFGSGWGSPITVTQDSNRLTVEYAFFIEYDLQPPLRFAYALDGSETRNTVMMGRGVQEQRSRVTWNGSTLVITTLHPFSHPTAGPITTEVRQFLTLESPTSLVIETTRVGLPGGPTTTTRSIYIKR